MILALKLTCKYSRSLTRGGYVVADVSTCVTRGEQGLYVDVANLQSVIVNEETR